MTDQKNPVPATVHTGGDPPLGIRQSFREIRKGIVVLWWAFFDWVAVVQWKALFIVAGLALAAAGCAILMWGSAELSAANLRGDLLAAFAGLLYTGYLIIVERTRGELQPLPLLFLASLFGAAMLLPVAAAAGETLIPADWTGLIALALCSQVVGQGLLVYALGHVPPLVVGIAMLTQPALSALLGWLYYGEAFTPLDWTGAAMIVVALILVRLREREPKPN